MRARLLLLLLPLGGIVRAADITYWIEPCTRAETLCQGRDPELAQWAMEAWEREAGGRFKAVKVAQMSRAQIRIHWADGIGGQYGEARPILVEGKQGAEVYIRPDTSQLGPDIEAATKKDGLLRDAIVYLTCLHESGHALGLSHTTAFDDIMYTFQVGGDIPEYFGRYRRLLSTRTDIAKHSGTSVQDVARLKRLPLE